MISNPTGTSSLLSAVASHIYLGPGTPVSAVLSLMNVPTAHPVQVPTSRDRTGQRGPGFGLRERPAQLPVAVAPPGDAEADAREDEAPAAFDQLLRRAAAARAPFPVQPEGNEDVETDPPPAPQDRSV